ncbi:MAG: hypothetical protein KTR31_17015 [Myxococcales bacterium]|nr:hypothetical protein [Myxococcales bacterium]
MPWVLPLLTLSAAAGPSPTGDTGVTVGTEDTAPVEEVDPNDAREAQLQGGGGCLELPTAAAASIVFWPLLWGLRRQTRREDA